MNDTADGSRHARAPISPRSPVAVFDSIHAVLAAERAFLAAGLACDLVPIPRGVTSDCGLALLFRAADLESARALLCGPTLVDRLRGVYRAGPGGYAPEAMTGPPLDPPTDGGPPARLADTDDSQPDRREPPP